MTRAELHALRIEAANAGDWEQVAICEAALDDDADARDECARVIAETQAENEYQRRLDLIDPP